MNRHQILFALVFLLAITVLLVVACGARIEGIHPERAVTRYVDAEAGVVCWILSTPNYPTAVDCMPIDDTLLK